jgi:hypothetical protein
MRPVARRVLAAVLAAAGAGLLALALAWSRAPEDSPCVGPCGGERTWPDPCDPHLGECRDLSDQSRAGPFSFGGVDVELDISDLGCAFAASWRTGGDAGPSVRATMFPAIGDVFPLGRTLVKLMWCHASSDPGIPGVRGPIPRAIVQVLDASGGDGGAPAAGRVIIPTGGWATLDGDRTASGSFLWDMERGTVATVQLTPGDSVSRRRLGVGDSFVWDDRVATIRKMMQPNDWRNVEWFRQLGWIEVELSPAGK